MDVCTKSSSRGNLESEDRGYCQLQSVPMAPVDQIKNVQHLTSNELPVELLPQQRYKFENILLTGPWFGQSKLNVSLFLQHFTSELSHLTKGCQFEDVTGNSIPSICRIQSVVLDIPAKSLLFNIQQFNNHFGCSTCTHPG